MKVTPIKGFDLAIYPKGDITQWFAENPSLYAFMGMKGHNGIDVVAPHGEPLRAIEDGVVVEVRNDPKGYGKHLRFVSDASDKGVHNEWTYGHNSVNYVKIGDKVTAGQVIALMGNTGFVVSGATPFWKNNPFAGTHLHLGLRKVKKPKRGGWSYEGSDMKLQVLNYNNGFKGSVDPVADLRDCVEVPDSDVLRSMQLTLVSLLNTVINKIK